MKNADIKIVGAVTDEDALEEIEDIAKVFAYEQRMKGYTSPLHKQHLAKKVRIKEEKNMRDNHNFLHDTLPRILVKGLC